MQHPPALDGGGIPAAAAPATATTEVAAPGGGTATTGGGGPEATLPTSTAPLADQTAAATAASTAATTSTSAAVAVASPSSASSSSRAARGLPRIAQALTRDCVATYHSHLDNFYKRVRLEGPEPLHNHGYDDQDGHYKVIIGELIWQRYAVQAIIGKGSFGVVVRCYDEKRNQIVAIKIVRGGLQFYQQAANEARILLQLGRIPALGDLVVQLVKLFDWKGHLCMAFELLSHNLYDMLVLVKFTGFSLDVVRKFAIQLLQVLQVLEEQDPPILHLDLKPENIMLRESNRSALRVIDFGLACYQGHCRARYVQSRFYRAPEVIMELEITTAVDRWSLACILVELHTGHALFAGRSEVQQLARFQGLLGPMPMHMIKASRARGSSKAAKFFRTAEPGAAAAAAAASAGGGAAGSAAALGASSSSGPSVSPSSLGAAAPPLAPLIVDPAGASEPLVLIQQPEERHITKLRQILGVDRGGPDSRRRDQPGHDKASYEIFCDFISKLLVYEPTERMSVKQAMDHPFIQPLISWWATYNAHPSGATGMVPPAGAPAPVHPRETGGGGGGAAAPPPPPATAPTSTA